MRVLGVWDLPEIKGWFSWVMVEIVRERMFPRFPMSDPAGPGLVNLVDMRGDVVYVVDPRFWESVAQILAQRNSALKGRDLAVYFQSQLGLLLESI